MGTVRSLLNVETIRRLTGWQSVEGRIEKEYGGLKFFCFRLAPDNSDLQPIRILCATNRRAVQEVRFGSASPPRYFQGWYSSEWWGAVAAIGFARSLVRGRSCLLATHGPGVGRAEYRYLRAREWPFAISRENCREAGAGDADLHDADGRGWNGPGFTRTFFNRGGIDAVPDWNAYVPVRLGWMTREARNRARRLEESLGMPRYKRLT